jgi:hypothetical protein
MIRYVVIAAVALVVLFGALWIRGRNEPADPAPEAHILNDRPQVQVKTTPEGRKVAVTYRCAGTVSRASLVYEMDGREHVADRANDCTKALGKRQGEMTTEVTLDGLVPESATGLRVLLEDETGTRVLPVELP